MNCRSFFIALLLLVFSFSFALATNGDSSTYTIAIPNEYDVLNQGRALLLLEALGIIKLDNSYGILPSKKDIISYGCKIDFVEAEVWDIPRILADVDYGIIPSDAASASDRGLLPSTDSLALLGSGDPGAMNI